MTTPSALSQLQASTTDIAVEEFARRNLDVKPPHPDGVVLSRRTIALLNEALTSALADVRRHV